MADDTELSTVTAELKRYGIKPSIEPTGSHIRVSWQLPGKAERSTVVPKTGSDYRGRLNARATVRRLIKADGVADPIIEHAAKPLNQQIIEPRKLFDPLPLQVAQMRQQLDDMSEMLVEISNALRSGIALPMISAPSIEPEATVAVDHYVAPAPYVKPSAASYLQVGSLQKMVYDALPSEGAPISTDEIAKSIERTTGIAGQTLTVLKKKGLVKAAAFKYWHRANVAVPEGWARPSAKTAKSPKMPGELSAARVAVLNSVPRDRTITVRELAASLGQQQPAILFHLGRLQKGGAVKNLGAAKTSRWIRLLEDGSIMPEAIGVAPSSTVRRPEGKKPYHYYYVRKTVDGEKRDAVLNLVPFDRAITTSDLAAAIGKEMATITYHLRRLAKADKVQKVGRGITTAWIRLMEDGTFAEGANLVPPKAAQARQFISDEPELVPVAMPKRVPIFSPPAAPPKPAGEQPMSEARAAVYNALPKDGSALTKHDIAKAIDKTVSSVGYWLTTMKTAKQVLNPAPGMWARPGGKVSIESEYVPRPGSKVERILTALSNKPVRVIDVVNETGFKLNEVTGKLHNLKLKGVVANAGRGLWVRA